MVGGTPWREAGRGDGVGRRALRGRGGGHSNLNSGDQLTTEERLIATGEVDRERTSLAAAASRWLLLPLRKSLYHPFVIMAPRLVVASPRRTPGHLTSGEKHEPATSEPSSAPAKSRGGLNSTVTLKIEAPTIIYEETSACETPVRKERSSNSLGAGGSLSNVLAAMGLKQRPSGAKDDESGAPTAPTPPPVSRTGSLIAAILAMASPKPSKSPSSAKPSSAKRRSPFGRSPKGAAAEAAFPTPSTQVCRACSASNLLVPPNSYDTMPSLRCFLVYPLPPHHVLRTQDGYLATAQSLAAIAASSQRATLVSLGFLPPLIGLLSPGAASEATQLSAAQTLATLAGRHKPAPSRQHDLGQRAASDALDEQSFHAALLAAGVVPALLTLLSVSPPEVESSGAVQIGALEVRLPPPSILVYVRTVWPYSCLLHTLHSCVLLSCRCSARSRATRRAKRPCARPAPFLTSSITLP